jgi:hypothetical protein
MGSGAKIDLMVFDWGGRMKNVKKKKKWTVLKILMNP